MSRLFTRIVWLLPVLWSCAHQKAKIFASVNDFIHVVFHKGEVADMPKREVDSELAPYIPQFLADAASHGHPVDQSVQDMLRRVVYVNKLSIAVDPGVMAVCARYYASDSTIFGTTTVKWMNIEVLRKESEIFTQGNVFQLRKLLYHELFHCFMDKGHLPKGIPGIMAPSMSPNDTSALTDWKQLVDDMFLDKYFNLIPNES